MAGRGVDIKLGGELNEEIIADVLRVLERAKQPDPYDMSNDKRLEVLKTLDDDQIGIYEESVKTFFEHFDNMAKVRELGGLHVIGSERHEARRIDNQLRGRAARQGDPGSSRFYLSLEDELMRLFGGVQMEALMGRLKVDPSLPIESGLLGKMVEQAQERVEGNNFDVRKHLLEYDDVLNSQRNRIYAERDRAFTKADLHEDVIELLRTELNERIPKALDDEEGPWKLLAYLEQVQPTMVFEQEGVRTPSFTLHLIEQELENQVDENASEEEIKDALLEIAGKTLDAETDHLLKSAKSLLEKTEETAEQVTSDRLDALDTYFDGLGSGEEEGQPVRRPQDILEEIAGLVSTPLRLSSEELRNLPTADTDVRDAIAGQVTKTVKSLAITRTINAIELRLEESLNMRPAQLIDLEWDEINDGLFRAVEQILDARAKNLLSANGTISQNIDLALTRNREQGLEFADRLVDLIIAMSNGTRMAIDPRTHQKVMRNVRILNYIFLGARNIQDKPVKEITADILEHLEETRERLEEVWGKIEFDRFRLAGVPLSQLEPKLKESLSEEFGADTFEEIVNKHPEELSEDQQEIVTTTLGTRIQNEIYRHILVSVFSEHWVEYLTKVDALRVSIGMEAFAQRDPLVQYKGEAAGMFRELLSDIRAGVISKMFLFQPRRAGSAVEKSSLPQPAQPVVNNVPAAAVSNKKKRKRH
jgi:preprotein translocase subunit SecA